MSELELWNELGNIYYRTGAFTEAVRTYQKVIELDPGCDQPYANLASIYVSQGRYAEAILMFQKRIERMGEAIDQASLWNQVGDAYRKLEDHENACIAYRKAIELDPHCDAFQQSLAEVEMASWISKSASVADTEQNPLPSASLDSAGPVSPEISGSGVSEPGTACWVFEDKKTSLQVEIKASTSVDASPVLLGNRSLDLADGISPIDPSGPVQSIQASTYGLLRLGILHWRKAEYERAILFLKIALDTAGRSQNQFHQALSYYILAKVETNMGKVEDAIQAYQSAANLAPENFFPWNNLGDLNCMLGRYEDARAAFQEAIEHDPKNSVSWNGLGDVNHKLGRNEDAIAAYQLGNVFENQQKAEDPLEVVEKAIETDQENPQIWDEAGDIYFDAVASYRKASELGPANANFRVHLARAEQALQGVNPRSVLPDPDALTGSKPEPLPHCEPFIAEKPSQEPETANRAEPEPVETEQAQADEALPEIFSSPAIAVTEPEPAYWMFKPVPQDGHTQQQDRHYLPLVDEEELVTAGPSASFAPQTRREQAFSCDQLLNDTFHDNASILVQLTPRSVKPARIEEIDNFPAAKLNQESAPVTTELRNSYSVAAEVKTGGSTPELITTGDQPADQAALDLQIIEHDITAYRRVTEINPKNDRAWDTLGNMYENIGLHSQAVTAFEQAIALAPHKEVYYYHLGIALGYQMQYNQAIQALQKVVELNPDYMLAHCALAGYYRRLGREAEALAHMEIARPSMEHENEYNQACFESIGGNADRAIALLETALKQVQVQPSLVQSDPDLDFIRKDPRFKELLARNSMIR
jgi:tetratricopeptide (TPR) repeat protein